MATLDLATEPERRERNRTITFRWLLSERPSDRTDSPYYRGDGIARLYVELSCMSLHPERKFYSASLHRVETDGNMERVSLFDSVRIASEAAPRFSAKNLDAFATMALRRLRHVATADPATLLPTEAADKLPAMLDTDRAGLAAA